MSARSDSGSFDVVAWEFVAGATSELCQLDEPTFQVADMGLGKILVFASEVNEMVPEVLVYVLLKPRLDRLSFADVHGWAARQRIYAGK
ncbi:MAG: hypothetical protein U1F19_06270 [Lysobacterales bacterium]